MPAPAGIGAARRPWRVRAAAWALTALCLAVGGAVASPARAAGAYEAYFAGTAAGRIGTIATNTNTLGSSTLSASSPWAMAITPNGATLYVCDFNAGTVTPISLATGLAGRPITVGANPSGIAITPDGSKAYVTNAGAATVTAINLLTGTTSTIGVGSQPSAVAITPDGSRAYVVDQNATVTPITIATNTPGPVIGVGTSGGGSNATAVAIAPDGSTVYVVNSGSNSIVPISVASNTAGRPIPGLSAPSAIAIAPDGRTAYIAEDGAPGHLVPMNLSTGSLGSPITVGANPYSVSISPDQKTAYVANFGGGFFGSVTPVSLDTDTPGPPIWTLMAPSSIVIAPDQAPVASLTVADAPAGSPSSFDASSSTVRYGSIASYAWNFGDGQSATTSTPTTTHVYATPGIYTATVTETDSAGTSTTQVFTGQTVSRDGALSARTARQVQIPERAASAPPVALEVPHVAAVTRTGQLVVTVYCPAWAVGGCRGSITVKRLPPRLRDRVLAVVARCGRGCRVLGGTSYAARAGHKVAARIHVSADVSRLLRSHKAVRMRLTVTNVLGGPTSTSSQTIVLRRGKRRHG